MTKLFYTTHKIEPTADYHFFNADLTPDLVTTMNEAGEVVTPDTAKFIRATFGKDAIATFNHDGIWTAEYRERVYKQAARDSETAFKYFVKF